MILDPTAAEPTFRDRALDDDLRSNGFATLALLTSAQVLELRGLGEDLREPGDSGMAVDYMRKDRSAMETVNDHLQSLWDAVLGHNFVDHRLVFGTFVVKHPGLNSAMFLHEDRSYVDERRHRAGTLWIPLVDTGPAIPNGCLHVVPGSHTLAVSFSGSNTPDLVRPFSHVLQEGLKPVAVAAGEGLFYDTRTLHASPANRTNEPRPAIACSIAPRDARLIHVVATTAVHRRMHEVDPAFFVRHGPVEVERSMPERYPVIEEFDDSTGQMDPALIRRCCELTEDPAPRVAIPEDLWCEFMGHPSQLIEGTPQRQGALTPTDLPIGEFHSLGLPAASEENDPSTWVPASLWPGEELVAWVGDPLVRPGSDGAGHLVLKLDPSERATVDLRGRSMPEVSVLDGPAVGSGFVAVGCADTFSPGSAKALPGAERVVLWNEGPGSLHVVLGHRNERGVLERLRAGSQRRAVSEIQRQVAAAIAT